MNTIPGGTVTTPRGFLAGATYAGLKTPRPNVLDLGILYSQRPCAAAGVFTSNRIKAAPVVLCQEHLGKGSAQAIVVNSGCANACTGDQGAANALHMAELAAAKLGISPQDVLVASTGVIGQPLPMDLVTEGIAQVNLSADSGHELARAIITTDTSPKEIAVAGDIGQSKAVVAGIAKGAGMIHPDLATLLCFLTTDAALSVDFLRAALKRAVDASFNMITIDGDTSPSDSVIILANGEAGGEELKESSEFETALREVCSYLAKEVARGGEGATKLIAVSVEGAMSKAEAGIAARTVASSPLVKAAVHGADPNWGRVLAAVGRSGVEIVESKVELYLGNVCLMKEGTPLGFARPLAKPVLERSEVAIRVCLNLGEGKATAWGCDLSEEYVRINSAYTT